jgi:EAL domain-containing protein (putative c-di-GMP-specific phosphodiesterase class I)
MRRVLVLDDDPMILRLLARTLQTDGLEILTCSELEAAEILMEHYDVDCVISDLCVSPFGDLEGGRLLGQLASRYPETRLVAISSTVNERVRALLARLGCGTVLEKPFSPQRLRKVVHELLGPPGAGAPRLRAFEPISDFLKKAPLHSVLQPIVRLDTGGLYGVECLARAPVESPYSNPEILFAYAGRKDLVAEADLLCVRAGLDEAKRFGGEGKVFVNVLPRSLSSPRFAEGIEALVAESGFERSRVVVEITERQTILFPKGLNASVARLRAAGFGLAVDDYGEGVSNLQMVLDLEPDILKIARHFTQGLDHDSRRRAVVGSTADLARRLGALSVIEGVENEAELKAARELGVDCAQGYHIARPARADALSRAAQDSVV